MVFSVIGCTTNRYPTQSDLKPSTYRKGDCFHYKLSLQGTNKKNPHMVEETQYVNTQSEAEKIIIYIEISPRLYLQIFFFQQQQQQKKKAHTLASVKEL